MKELRFMQYFVLLLLTGFISPIGSPSYQTVQGEGRLLSQHVSVVEGHFLTKYLDLIYRNTLADQLQNCFFWSGQGQFFPCTGLSVSEAPRRCRSSTAIVCFYCLEALEWHLSGRCVDSTVKVPRSHAALATALDHLVKLSWASLENQRQAPASCGMRLLLPAQSALLQPACFRSLSMKTVFGLDTCYLLSIKSNLG